MSWNNWHDQIRSSCMPGNILRNFHPKNEEQVCFISIYFIDVLSALTIENVLEEREMILDGNKGTNEG